MWNFEIWPSYLHQKLRLKNGINWRIISPQFFLPKKTHVDLKFSKMVKFLKNIAGNMAVFIFFWFTHLYWKKKLSKHFFKKNFLNYFSYICLHIISDFEQIPRKNTLSMAICSLKVKKSKITQNLKNAHSSAVSGPRPKLFGVWRALG